MQTYFNMALAFSLLMVYSALYRFMLGVHDEVLIGHMHVSNRDYSQKTV